MSIQIANDASGSPVVMANNVSNFYMPGLGAASGSFALDFENVGNDQTLFNFTNESSTNPLIFQSAEPSQNYGFNGSNVSAELGQNDDIYWNVQNGNLVTGGTANVDLAPTSSDNYVSLERGDNTLTDEGAFNTTVTGNGVQNITTAKTSNGAIIVSGPSDSNITLNGTNAFFYARGGNNNINLTNTSSGTFLWAGPGNNTIVNNSSSSSGSSTTGSPGTPTVTSVLSPFTSHTNSYNFLSSFINNTPDLLSFLNGKSS